MINALNIIDIINKTDMKDRLKILFSNLDELKPFR